MGLIERFVATSLRQRLFVLLCLAAAMLTGVVAYRDLPVEAFPDLTNNQVTVVTEAPGLAAVEVEQRVSYPIETALMGVPRAEQVRAMSKAGLSLVTVVFEDAMPIYLARQLVNERISEVRERLPMGMAPTLGPLATAFGEIYQYLVEGDADLMDRKTIHDWELRTQLRSVTGVGDVNSWGGLTRQYQVVVDPAKLDRFGLTLAQVSDAIAANNTSFSGGFIEHHSERFTVRGTGLATTDDDIRRIVVDEVNGVPVIVADVATVRIGAAPRQGAVTTDGSEESIAGMVIMLKGENGKDVGERVKARIAEVIKTLPGGLRIVPFYDQTEVIDRTSATVRRNLIEGSLLVVIVLFVFLRDVRASLLVAAVIPASLLAGFIGMHLFGVSANLMSLGAIDFGLIVDGAVVMMENFIRRRSEASHNAEHHDSHDPHGSAEHHDAHGGRMALFTSAATEVARPILFGVLIIVAVYLPIFTLEGLEGKMFRPMAITVCSAILGSLLLSLTVVPVASSFLLKMTGAHSDERWFVRLREVYLAQLGSAMNHPVRTMTVALVAVGVALGSLPFLGTEFMPKLDEGSILIETRKLPSVSLDESIDLAKRAERIVRSFPEVSRAVTKIGRPDIATEAMGIYQGDLYVSLRPVNEWTTGRDKAALIDAMSSALETMPGMTFNFTQPMAMRLDEVISGVKADVAVKIFGQDPTTLERLGAVVAHELEQVRGARDLQTEVLFGAAQLQISIDREQIARYGVNVEDVRNIVEAVVGGSTVSELLDGPRRFPIVVQLTDEMRANPQAVGNILLTGRRGERVPLSRLARIEETRAPETINHENAERRLVVQTNVRGRDVGGFVAEAQKRIDAALTLPPGYRIAWGGQFENQARAMTRLALVVPLSIAIIFLLLFVTFGRLRHATLVLLNVPFALVGGIAALWIRDLTLNLSASVGFIALFGVAVLNGVVLVTAVNRLRDEGQSLREAVLSGAATRLRPVLMTAMVAAFGFIPMALSHSAGAEIQRPLASVVIGGIATSTMLTLMVLPTLYERLEQWILNRASDD
ncbi:MAG: CusA/CzcA family heavy metal efflux RND transporter [Acidobacteriaceae bacterium]|jgi:cobalt-zinc-cadmium resistance protein CzcA|nr:CusA/CzcA family heavy metal efflux RND transporter [Acidobacteriaceae bacterium]